MKFIAIEFFALLASIAMAAPSPLERRQNCGQIEPACFGGSVVGQTNCRCPGQVETCDLWTCPGGLPNVVSLIHYLS